MLDDFAIEKHITIDTTEPAPGLERRSAKVNGGPLDGAWILFHDSFDPLGVMQIDLPVATGEGTVGEPYMLVPLEDEHGTVVEWDVVWLSWYRPGIRIDRDPDVTLLRQTHAMMGSELLTEPCETGTHDWNPWVPTPRGNRTRSCNRCKVTQGSVV